MKREKLGPAPEPVCVFETKDALVRAALVAERELETTRMFEPQIVGMLRRPISDAPAPLD
jgi:hypothetical protein